MRCYILLSILLVFLSMTLVKSQEYEDNDFAEFEDFDEDFESKKPSPLDNSDNEQEKSSFKMNVKDKDDSINNKKNAKEFESNDDQMDEATVEDEDDSDEFSHFNDAEEFVGYTNDLPKANRHKSQEEPKITFTQVPLHLRSNWDSYYLEMVMIAGLIVYFVNFLIGKIKNQKLANAWFDAHQSLLESNFALVGDDCKPEVESSHLLKESENVYTLWCSGRTNVEGMLVELKLIKRQDLIGVFMQMVRPSSDQLLIKVQLEEMDSFVFALATKKTANRLSKEMTDISTFCCEKKPIDKYDFGSKIVMITELSEVASAILGDPKVTAILNKYMHLFDFFHFSDQYSGPKQQEETPTKLPEVSKCLLFGFNFAGKGNPSMESIEGMKPLLQLVFYLTDKLRKFKLSKESKAKAEKNRVKVEEAFLKATHAARAEMAQAKREEKKRAERERMLEIDDPDKQRKWEEKEQKKNNRRRAPKMKQLKIG